MTRSLIHPSMVGFEHILSAAVGNLKFECIPIAQANKQILHQSLRWLVGSVTELASLPPPENGQ
jgi:aspartate ammonia-lyase